jgi:membrane protease YdiL (CAAX protease family)
MAIRAAVSLLRGQPLVTFEPRSRPRLNMADVGVPLLLSLSFSLIAVPLLLIALGISLEGELSELSPNAFLLLLAANAVGTILPCLVLLAMVWLRTGSASRELGLSLHRAAYDIRLGIGAFLLMAGFVYLIQSILSTLFPQQHPLLEMISRNPQPRLFVGAFLSAAVVAPVCEELFFRAALQGWLEKYFLTGREDLPPDDRSPAELSPIESENGIVWASPADPVESAANPYASPRAISDSPPLTPADEVVHSRTVWTPILISSLLFSLAHVGHGPAPIPLFLLAMGLGYLYQKTHRLLPCITVHFLLNATSIVMLWLYAAA